MGEGGFMVVVRSARWHATTVIPNMSHLRSGSGDTPEFIEIDSLSGGQTGMSSDDLCSIILRGYPNPTTGGADDAPIMQVPDVLLSP